MYTVTVVNKDFDILRVRMEGKLINFKLKVTENASSYQTRIAFKD